MVLHNIAPVFDAHSRILLLGSFPSVKSREAAFFYAHPQNRFWPLLAMLCGEPTPRSIAEKRALLLRRRIALWDVIASCEIAGSADASIRSAAPNDLARILRAAPIEAIFCNGGTAYAAYRRLAEPSLGRSAVRLPSTSAANASWSMARLCAAWQTQLAPYIGEETVDEAERTEYNNEK